MGLDQYAYARPPRKRNGDDDEQICDWRKHNRLQGWMQQLWEDKGCPNAQTEGDEMGDFNCVELQLTAQDIDNLEYAIENFELPEANGFFWGSDSYFWNDENDEPFPENEYWYKKHDLNFVEQARKMLDKKWRVYYSCWY
ncbi:MAG: hypothetical protein ACPG2Y_00925 [Acholeplasmataceae bacterium]